MTLLISILLCSGRHHQRRVWARPGLDALVHFSLVDPRIVGWQSVYVSVLCMALSLEVATCGLA